MRKRLTFEEAANLKSYVEAPARLPNHADVNGNPVYKQFLRLTQIYEEDEVRKRQDDLHDLWARMHDPRLGSGFRAPPRPRQLPENVPPPPNLGMRGMGAPGNVPGRAEPGPMRSDRPPPAPPVPQFMTIDDDGVPTEPAESSEEFFSDAEAELADLQEKAARNAAAARTLADQTQN